MTGMLRQNTGNLAVRLAIGLAVVFILTSAGLAQEPEGVFVDGEFVEFYDTSLTKFQHVLDEHARATQLDPHAQLHVVEHGDTLGFNAGNGG